MIREVYNNKAWELIICKLLLAIKLWWGRQMRLTAGFLALMFRCFWSHGLVGGKGNELEKLF